MNTPAAAGTSEARPNKDRPVTAAVSAPAVQSPSRSRWRRQLQPLVLPQPSQT